MRLAFHSFSDTHLFCPIAKTSQFHSTYQGILLCNLTGQSHLKVLYTLFVHKLQGDKKRNKFSE